jgi:hypothetical protein
MALTRPCQQFGARAGAVHCVRGVGVIEARQVVIQVHLGDGGAVAPDVALHLKGGAQLAAGEAPRTRHGTQPLTQLVGPAAGHTCRRCTQGGSTPGVARRLGGLLGGQGLQRGRQVPGAAAGQGRRGAAEPQVLLTQLHAAGVHTCPLGCCCLSCANHCEGGCAVAGALVTRRAYHLQAPCEGWVRGIVHIRRCGHFQLQLRVRGVASHAADGLKVGCAHVGWVEAKHLAQLNDGLHVLLEQQHGCPRVGSSATL